MNYTDRIEAVKWLQKRCEQRSADDDEALLNMIEDAFNSGMWRKVSSFNPFYDWLTRVLKDSTREKTNAKLRKEQRANEPSE